MKPAPEMHTVDEVATRYGVTEATVLDWIHAGELAALNVGRRANAKRPRWRISRAALEAFELARSASPTPTRTSRKRRTDNVIEFYA